VKNKHCIINVSQEYVEASIPCVVDRMRWDTSLFHVHICKR